MTGTRPQNRSLGYARVSTYGQTLDAQLEQLRGAGCIRIYREKVTSAHSDRRELLKMLNVLSPGGVVTVARIDRLVRSTFDLFGNRQADRGCQGAISFTRGAVGRHRHQHRAIDDSCVGRIGGRGARSNPHPHRRGAQKRGQHMGRPPKLTPAQKAEARRRRAQGTTLAELARSDDVGKSTISRLTALATGRSPLMASIVLACHLGFGTS
jgi:hypothetical protein